MQSGAFMNTALIIVAIVVAIVIFSLRGTRPIAAASTMNKTIEITQKINFTIEMLLNNLDKNKLNSYDEKYTYYYVGYIDAYAKLMCEVDGIEYDKGIQILIESQAGKLCFKNIDNDESYKTAVEALQSILDSEYGKKGSEDGKADAEYSYRDKVDGPPYTKARSYFGLPPLTRR